MQLIDELEPVARSFYAGSIGRWSYTGDFDSCITLRSIHVRGNHAYWQASAGIVADSIRNPNTKKSSTKQKSPAKS